jgi:hypothetical protein
MSIENVLGNISNFSGLIPLVAGMYNYKRLSETFKIVAIFFIVAFGFDMALMLVRLLGYRNNLPFIHLFLLINLLVFAWIYYREFQSAVLKKITLILAMLVLIAVGYSASKGLITFPTVSYTSLSVACDILSLLFFYQLLNGTEFIHIEKQAMFWFNSAVIFYFGTNIFLFMLYERSLSQNLSDVWVIHDVTNLIANILYSVALLCKPRKI